MPLDDLNSHLSNLGGDWRKLKDVGDSITVIVVDAEIRDKRDMEGNVVLSRKNKTPRKEVVVTGDVDGDTVKISLNEGAQTAVKNALVEAGVSSIQKSGTLTVKKVGEEGDAPFKYGIFKAKYVAPVQSTISIDDI